MSHPPLIAIERPQYLQGVPGALYAGTHLMPQPRRLLSDYRHSTPTTGRIVDYVMLKASPTAPEVPFVRGRVWLLRAIDGYKAHFPPRRRRTSARSQRTPLMNGMSHMFFPS